jgi:DNA-binding NtrC family response regulator
VAPRAVVIRLTAFGSPGVHADALRLGASAVLDKPFNLDDLNGLIADALARPH